VKGNSSCHIPSDKYRDGWDMIFGKKINKNESTDNSRDKLLGSKSVFPANDDTPKTQVIDIT